MEIKQLEDSCIYNRPISDAREEAVRKELLERKTGLFDKLKFVEALLKEC
jgi:hypothetical protein